ncbi:hypothetical protein Tco_0975906 [Tanacetum coccineum]|uniref:Uncharacterized protein n=1 Tax=Tanacetum coccineum TaxID=301880 RepID=A0ABQ5EFQ2_9ASTR
METNGNLSDLVDQVYTKEGRKKSELRKEQGIKIDLGRSPFATMRTETIPLQSHPLREFGRIQKKSSVEGALVPIPKHSETFIDYNDDSTSSDDDSYENIEYVDASPPDVEIVSLEVVEIVDPEIDSLRDNPTPSSEVVIKSTSTFPNLFLEETNTFDNSIPESETFRFNLERL